MIILASQMKTLKMNPMETFMKPKQTELLKITEDLMSIICLILFLVLFLFVHSNDSILLLFVDILSNIRDNPINYSIITIIPAK